MCERNREERIVTCVFMMRDSGGEKCEGNERACIALDRPFWAIFFDLDIGR